ncbi:MAG: hypothetical protein KIS80_08250 [Anaerolineales bacterium]|nr:hypothetical protein [Anaerolineales bacterium]
MNNKKRSYLQMQFEEATLESGRYNSDYVLQNPAPDPVTLLQAFRNTAVRLGSDFNRPPQDGMGVAALKHSSQN